MIELRTQIEEAFEEQRLEISKQWIDEDMQWLYNTLKNKATVKYLRVVTKKPKGTKTPIRRWSFTAYLVQRKDPKYNSYLKDPRIVWMLYMVPRFR